MKSRQSKFADYARTQSGFSLIELMIAIALGLLILAGMLTVFANTSGARNEIDRVNRQIENGRYATELLRDDIQLAGYFGETDIAKLRGTPGLPSAMPNPCATSLTERTWPTGGTIGAILLHVQGTDNFNPATSTYLDSCPTIKSAVKPGTDVIIVRRVKTCTAGATGCDAISATKPFLQVSMCVLPPTVASSTTTTHALAPDPTTNAAEFVHKIKDCTTAAPLRPYVIYMYFVGTDNVLKRVEFVNGTGMHINNVTPLVDGIESLQIEYGVDTDNDGNADAYKTAAVINALATPAAVVSDWSNVVTVKVNVLARSTETSPGYTDTKTYPAVGVTTAFGDAYRRHVYGSLIRITNVSGSRERP